MLRFLGTLGLCLAVQIAVAENTPVGDKPPNVDAASVKSETQVASEKNDRAFKPPYGFKTMKRGNLVVYCRQNDTTTGSRFKTAKCYDAAGLRSYLLALEQLQRFPLLDAR
jgi:hypothetical protein